MTKQELKLQVNQIPRSSIIELIQKKKRGLFWWIKLIGTLLIEVINILTQELEENGTTTN